MLTLVALFLFPSALSLFGEGEERERRIIPLPVLFFAPETGIGFGASAVYYVTPYSDAVIQKPDVVSAVAFYTQKNQLLVAAGSETYFRRSGDRLSVEGIAQRFPDKFWGVGPDTAARNEEGYTPFEVGFGIGYQWNISQRLFLGPLYVFSLIDTREVEEGGLLDEGLVRGSGGARASGLGVRFTADSRDSTFYPRQGYLTDATAILYGKFLGSTQGFSQLFARVGLLRIFPKIYRIRNEL